MGSDKGFSHRQGSENLGLLFSGRPVCPKPLSCCVLVGELSGTACLGLLVWKRHVITIVLAHYDCIPATCFQLVVSCSGSPLHPTQPSPCIKHRDVHLVLGFVPRLCPCCCGAASPRGTEADSYSLRHTADREMRPRAVCRSEAEATT